MQERDLSGALMKSSSEALMSFDKSEFDQLRSNRMAYVDGLRRNKGFEAGILGLLTQLYPDNAHFIYELLQNAEDAKASHARFRLTKESLIFEHDGSRLFSARDVESITSIGDSTKADSPTEIGKFGVGFKAVFAYTQTPEVHSGDYHFRIRDLVVPELLTIPMGGVDGFDTQFTFPFDHLKKTGRSATTEIAGALQALGDATLLFLSNIGRISYVLPDGSMGSLERVLPSEMQQAGRSGEHIQVTVNSPSAESRRSNWLLYRQTVTIEDESTSKECAIAVAFGLGEESGRTMKSKWRMIPLSPGRVCIYFPADKETSNLRFHLHAPFASTVARDSVRDSKGNDRLLAAIAELAASSMEDIRDRGLLTTAFLNILPIEDDGIPPFYRPIMDRLIDTFKKSALVPSRYAGHRAGDEIFRGPSDLVNLINDEDLEFLTRGQWENVAWCANTPQANQRADKFLDSLAIDEWGWNELCASLNCAKFRLEHIENDLGRPARLSAWLSDKEDSWLRRFYSVLHEATEKHISLDVTDLAFIRIEREGVFSLVKPAEAFFPLNDKDTVREDVLLVKPATYLAVKAATQSSTARQFLEWAGVRVFDEAANLERLIATYVGKNYPDLKVHLGHMKTFLEFFKARPDRLDVFLRKAIFIGQKKDNEEEIKLDWRRAGKLYLDLPFEDTGLAGTVAVKDRWALWSGYEKVSAKKAFVEFVKALGIQSELAIIEASTWQNPDKNKLHKDYLAYGVRKSGYAKNEDWTIDGIDVLVRSPTIENSRILWSTLIRASSTVAFARYRPNQQYKTIQADSQLVHCLKNHAWIPDSEGRFHFPKDIGRGQLPTGFVYDDRNGLLTAIGFEASIQRQTEEYQRKDVAAKEFGFDGLDAASEIAKALRKSGMGPKAAAELILQNSARPEQPEEEVRNPSRRRRGVLEHRENAPTKEAVRRERSIQSNVQGVVAEAKAYLRAKYTNGQGQMVCQVCRNEMPFKLGTGEHYFEAVQAIRGLSQNYYENRLALCPTCAAMYQYARACTDTELKDRVEAIDGETAGLSVELEVVLAGLTRKIRFVGTHFFDLRVVLDGSEAKD
jgi:hypothetical protein